MNAKINVSDKSEATMVFKRPADLPTQYVESISQMIMGFPNTRLIFNRFVEKVPGEKDIHHQCLEMIIPTATLIENCMFILEQVMANKATLDTNRALWTDAIDRVLSRLSQEKPTSESR